MKPTKAERARRAAEERNPFFASRYGDMATFYLDAVNRLERVKRFGRAQCADALCVKGLQKTVRIAIERRLRRLEVRK